MSPLAGKRLCFVVPRYGEAIVGGAERLTRELALQAAGRGAEVSVFTTCALDHSTWSNVLQPGVEAEAGVTVERFEVDARDSDVWVPLQLAISRGENLSVEDQLRWMASSVNSRTLYAQLADRGSHYDALFFAPYLFGTTFWGSQIHPERSFLIPCLHDESYAYLPVIAVMFRTVAGCICNALPEADLVRRLYGSVRCVDVGMGFELGSSESPAAPYFEERFPYIVYLGRKETGKNVHLLIDLFCSGKDRGWIPDDVRLVIAGGGNFSDLERPAALARSDVIDLARVEESEKASLLSNCVALCQPSVNESFSIVLMEAWQHEVPVLVHANCSVTKYHVVESNGGAYFSNAQDFAAAVCVMHESADLRRHLGKAGREYVSREYNWEAVMQRFERGYLELSGRRQRGMASIL